MGLLRRKLRRLQRAADGHTTLLTCRDTGEQIRVPDDAALRLIVADWREGAGEECEDSLVEWLSPYLKRGLLDERGREWPIGDVGGGLRGLTG
jgi:hypothetical protein